MKKGKHPDKALSAVRARTVTKPGRYADGNGLYLIVEPSGAKRWMMRTIVQGKRRDIGLGGCKVCLLYTSLGKPTDVLKWIKTNRGTILPVVGNDLQR